VVDAAGGLSHLFPTPDALVDADLTTIGLTRARAAAVVGLATAVRDGQLALDQAASLDDTVAALERIAGIGPWTAQYVAMRATGEPDAFPDGDLGLRKAASTDGQPLSARDLAARAERWRPWRAYAAMLLWTHERGRHDHH
jgi:AraC family transcriptional regulator of adaptative response / DNA-3-methyladenine glycosylase II